jgi:hypothetical protein
VESLVGKKFEYKGLKISHLTVLTEPRVGYHLKRKGGATDNKSCNTICVCGVEKEVKFLDITHRHTTTCKGCGRSKGEVAFKRAKSLFEYWMSQWKPETHKPCTFKLPYFSGGVGEEYIKGWCYVDKETYDHCSKVMCVKPKHYVMYNHTKDNTYRLGIEYLGKGFEWVLIHRYAGKIQEGFMGDHIKGFKLDNRAYNIRQVTCTQNRRNNKVVSNKHGFRGVVLSEGRTASWRSRLILDGKYHSKMHNTLEGAIEYRDCFVLYIQGEYGYLNYEDKREHYRSIMLQVLTPKHLALVTK